MKNTQRKIKSLVLLPLLATLPCAYAEDINVGAGESKVWESGTTELGTLTITQGAEGQTSRLSIAGDTTLAVPSNASSNSSVGASSAEANRGSAILEVSGSNNLLDFQGGAIWLGPNSQNSFYGDAQIIISGSNNTFISGSMVIGRGNSGGSTLFSMTGSNNVFQHTGAFRDYLYLGRNGAETAGTNKVYLKGDGSASDSRVYFYAQSAFKFNGSATNDVSNVFVMDGNATFQKKDKTSGALGNMDLHINSSGAETFTAYGKSRFEVNNSGNDVDVNVLALGNNTQVAGSTSTFSISGGGSDINVEKLRVVGGVGTSVSSDAISGGVLEFKFTEGSISTLNVVSIEEFSGTLVLDFRALGAGEYSFDLISSSNNWSAMWNDFAWDNDSQSSLSDRISIVGANGEVILNYVDGTLSASYSAIPEPATFALLFGALALGVLRFRRR